MTSFAMENFVFQAAGHQLLVALKSLIIASAFTMTKHSCSFALIFIWPFLLLCSGAVPTIQGTSSSTADKSEEWGYVEVRQGAHMFWWLYTSPTQTRTEWPLLLWLQGGPGGSGVGIGNFEEIGPLTTALLPRPYTWLQKADLLFVDSPVGTGFSYVENTSLLCSKDEDVVTDLVSLLQRFFESHQKLQLSPFFIFAESYGGKHATLLGLALNRAIKSGFVKAKLGGVALGDSWISPVDSVLSWGPVLKTFSRIDDYQEDIVDRKAKMLQSYVNSGAYLSAFESWNSLEVTILNFSNNVDFYNVLLDEEPDSSLGLTEALREEKVFLRYGSYLNRKTLKASNQIEPDLTSLMNGPIRQKLQIIPDTVTWKELSRSVFLALKSDFMRDVIPKVDELLSNGINVTIYTGQLDLICATQGTEAWFQKLNWTGMHGFQDRPRSPLYCNSSGGTAAFVKSYRNLAFYWILLAGHMVPADNPCIALDMVELITKPT